MNKASLFLSGLILPALLCVAMLHASHAQASVIIAGTRIIYPAQEREITVSLRNTATEPALIQAWVDRGDPNTKADEADAPFLVTPPLARIEPEKGQALRLIFIPEALPADKESLFFFNMLDIPPITLEENQLRIAIRSRLKLFFRPKGLHGTPVEAARNLRWEIARQPHGSTLHCINRSAFHVSLSDISLDGASMARNITVAPGETKVLPFDQATSQDTRITYYWINDYGTQSKEEAAPDI